MCDMVQRNVKQILAKNLAALMKHKYGKIHQSKLRDDSGIAHATIGRLLRAEVAPNTETLDQIAKSFKLDAWALLVKNLDPEELPYLSHPAGVGLERVVTVYKTIDDEGRAFMDNASNVSWVMFQSRVGSKKFG